MNHGVSDPLGRHQDEGDDGERDLEVFRAPLAGSSWLGAPLRGGAGAQGANAPDDVEINEGAEGRGYHHGDSDGVAMESCGGRVDAEGGRRQSAEADGDSNSAEGDDGCAGTLQNDEDEAGGGDEPGFSALRWGKGRRWLGRDSSGGCLKGHLFLKL